MHVPVVPTSGQVSLIPEDFSSGGGVVQVCVVLEPRVEAVLPEAAGRLLSLSEGMCLVCLGGNCFVSCLWLLLTEFLVPDRVTSVGQGGRGAFEACFAIVERLAFAAQSGKVLPSV
jgi:hypothetical protein